MEVNEKFEKTELTNLLYESIWNGRLRDDDAEYLCTMYPERKNDILKSKPLINKTSTAVFDIRNFLAIFGYDYDVFMTAYDMSIIMQAYPDYEAAEKGTRIAKYNGSDKRVEIPYGIRTIAPYAFKGNENVEEIIIPDSVRFIGNGAFEGCTKLSKMKMSKKIFMIGDHAFFNTALVKNIDVTKIDVSKNKIEFDKIGGKIVYYSNVYDLFNRGIFDSISNHICEVGTYGYKINMDSSDKYYATNNIKLAKTIRWYKGRNVSELLTNA